jgi:serine/threonine protein kinase
MIEETTLWQTSATTAPGTVRWKAPELLSGKQQTVTAESDMYAFAMTCFVSYTYIDLFVLILLCYILF